MLVYCNKKNITPFYSVALAIKYDGWDSLVCYYDPNEDIIKIEKIWQESNNYENRAFYNIPFPDDNFVTKGKRQGLDWIVDKIPLFFAQNKKFDNELTKRARELYKTMQIPKWYEVSDEKSGNCLLEVAGYFHDAVIESVQDIKDGKRIVFDTTWGYFVVLDLKDLTVNEKELYSYSYIDADISVSENIILSLHK